MPDLFFFQEEKVIELKHQVTALQTKIVELQKSPFAKTKQDDTLDEMWVHEFCPFARARIHKAC